MNSVDPITSEGFGGIKFRYLTKEDIPEALEHARVILFPSLSSFGFNHSMDEDWLIMFRGILESTIGMTFVAIDTASNDKIVGLRVIILVNKDDPEMKIEFKCKHNEDIYDHIVRVEHATKVFERYPEVDKIADMFGISVDPAYQNQGIATEIYKRALILLKQKEFKVVRCGFLSPWSRKAATNLGWKELVRVYHKDVMTSAGTPLVENADPEDYLDYGVFEL